MKTSTISNKKRLIISLFVILGIVFLLLGRIGYLQVVKGEELKKQALEQWTRGIPVKPKRGIIYDRNKKKLAVSISKDTIWVRPADLDKEKLNQTSKELAKILKLEEKEVSEKLKSEQNLVKVKQWIEKEQSEQIREKKFKGIEIVEDNKRQYVNGNFAAHIIGHTNVDQIGQYGVESMFNDELTGVPGKLVKTTDAKGRQLPDDYEKLYKAKNGLNVTLTIDQTIQSLAEELAQKTQVEHNSKNASIVVMDVKTGELLAMANKPDYDPNEPKVPASKKLAKEWEKETPEERQKNWFEMWRNFPINDIYEPGSTFKIITSAAGLEEDVVNDNSEFYCGGKITRVKNGGSFGKAHGYQNLEEAFKNSCNVAMSDIALDLGAKEFYKYIKDFGFGEKTGISLTGEATGLIPGSAEEIKDIDLTRLSYGYRVSVTPMQLITSVSSVVNGGNLMKPQIIKELTDVDGKVVEEYEPEIIRKPISKATSKKMLKVLEAGVGNDAQGQEFVPGYKVGGKTGTAQKFIDGEYQKTYVGSFIGVAPIDDPEIAVLVVVDEPDPDEGGYYGNLVAKPAAGELMKETLEYLEIAHTETKDDEESKEVIVPDVKNETIKKAGEIILDEGLEYEMDVYSVEEDDKIKEQFPAPGTKVKRGSIIELYLDKKSE